MSDAAEEIVVDALIVGAGFAGLYQLLCLRDRLGLSVQVLEAGDGVGGTWYWNRYPGARCDSESHSYAFYFSDDLLQEWNWSERYPAQAEILRYLNHVADRFDLRRDIRCGTRVTGADYDAAANRWHVRTDTGARYAATYLVTAVGCLSAANVPSIPGLDGFAGRWVHTGQWPQEGVDFTGRRVGMIGTGSTGIQAAPAIAETAAHLTVFQRTANYSIPARNAPLTEEFKHWAKANTAELRRLMHSSTNGHPFLVADRSVHDVSPEEREAIYRAAWDHGGLRFRATFRDILTDKAANDTAADFLRDRIREVVKDPGMAAILSDIDHPFATKRPPIDTGYFETFNRENVSLVDLRATPIERVTPAGIVTRDGTEHPLDIIVFATGFDAMTGPLLRMDIRGRDGLALHEAWRAGPLTYLGLQVAGFPNLFTITGPGSPSVLTNMPVAIEQHVEWITACIAHLRASGLARIEPAPDAVDRWVAHVNEAADATLLPQAGHSWYLGANVPGKPRVFMPYAGGMARYRAICDEVAARGYEGFALSA
ncbi:NAD(P)/FAD-dependent oxidoreductase [Roseomonas eburnea]|uniref:NAD(P)/FAD-dependent oxidoreductase n=1 Tax=Neoroseomonas eburnea TaxID=1346889 RepID=A0A9X9XC80_9PROT|nr:NAD(P)/FAD-dependent oxidoreductase [Neoroseomonas eburnea]MBR0681316.1 NAD(P)/FAD-dependent oxidoreductase [Neoroseomonas eburnea]